VQILWVLDFLPDLASDFSAIHRISDMYSLPSSLFFNFATRMSCYKGVIKALLEDEIQQKEKNRSGGGERTVYSDDNDMVESDPVSLQSNFGDIMEVAEG